jgi:hypothetical protein
MAEHQIRTFNLEDGELEKFTSFGVETQTKAAEIAEQALNHLRLQVVEEARKATNELVSLITATDCSRLLNEENVLWKFFGRSKSKEEIRSELNQVYEQIKQQINIINDNLPRLVDVRESFDNLQEAIPIQLDSLEATIICAKFIADHITKNNRQNELAEELRIIERRIESLKISHLTILQNIEQAKLLKTSIVNLICVSEHTALALIPLWYSNFLNVLAIDTSNSGQNRSKLTELIKLQTEIITELKGE